jgi:hypothetical protein
MLMVKIVFGIRWKTNVLVVYTNRLTYIYMILACCGTPPHSHRCPPRTRPRPRSRLSRSRRTPPSRSTPQSKVCLFRYFYFKSSGEFDI